MGCYGAGMRDALCAEFSVDGSLEPSERPPRSVPTWSNKGYLATIDDWRTRIAIEPGKRGGRPCLRGLRITVYDVLEYLASGMSEDEILHDFPDLEREDIRAALAFAAEREKKISQSSAA